MTIISRRHTVNFYFTIIGVAFFILGLGTVWLAAFMLEYNHAYLLPVMAGLMPVAAGYIVYRYYKYVPIITIDEINISFNSEQFLLADIQKIELTGKRNLPISGKFLTEAAT